MPAGTSDSPRYDHGGSYLVGGKERQPVTPATPTEERPVEEQPDALIKKAVEAAREHFRRLTKPGL